MTRGVENVRAEGDKTGPGIFWGFHKSHGKRDIAGYRINRTAYGSDSAPISEPAKSTRGRCVMVIRKTLVTTSLCGLLFAGVPGTLFGHPGTTSRIQASQDQQTPQQATKSITGKVTD